MSDELEDFPLYSAKSIKAQFAANLKKITAKNQLKALPSEREESPVREEEIEKGPTIKRRSKQSQNKTKTKPPKKDEDLDINLDDIADDDIDYNPGPAPKKRATGGLRRSKRLSRTPVVDDIVVETIVTNKRTRVSRSRASARGRNRASANAPRTRLGFLIQPDSPPMPELIFTGFESNKKDEHINMDDEEINPEISIKIHWKSMDVKRFTLRKFQTFSSLFEQLSTLESVKPEEILLIKNENKKPKFIQPTDTPDSLNIRICDILEGGVITIPRPPATATATPALKKNEILLKFQDTNKKIISLSTNRSDKMKVVMIKCAELLEKHLRDIRFIFDGDEIDPEETVEDLDLEGGEVIDIKVSV